jgi:hypothetical protein
VHLRAILGDFVDTNLCESLACDRVIFVVIISSEILV